MRYHRNTLVPGTTPTNRIHHRLPYRTDRNKRHIQVVTWTTTRNIRPFIPHEPRMTLTQMVPFHISQLTTNSTFYSTTTSNSMLLRYTSTSNISFRRSLHTTYYPSYGDSRRLQRQQYLSPTYDQVSSASQRLRTMRDPHSTYPTPTTKLSYNNVSTISSSIASSRQQSNASPPPQY